MYLLISEAQNFGGTDTYLISVYEELKLRKNKVKVIINDDHSRLSEYSARVEPLDLIYCKIPSIQKFHRYRFIYRLTKPVIIAFLSLRYCFFIKKSIQSLKVSRIIIVNGGWPGGLMSLSPIVLSIFMKKFFCSRKL